MLNNAYTPLPTIFIPKDVINRRVKLFMQKKHPLLSEALTENGITRQDTRSVWYSKEHMEIWLNEMNLYGADGMRIYFGAYAEEDGIRNGQLCLLMVLTRPGGTSDTHRDIVFEDEGPGARSLNGGGDDEEEEGRPKQFNYGSPCPPICAEGDAIYPLD
jgi:hypothetical protein